MRTGTWRSGTLAQQVSFTGTIAGHDVEIASIEYSYSAAGGNPFDVTQRGISQGGKVTVNDPETAASVIGTPWSPKTTDAGGDWPPRRGDVVSVSVGDGAGQEWPVMTGRLDQVPGNLLTNSLDIDLIDRVDLLNRGVSVPAQMAHLPPRVDGGPYRRGNLSVEWVLDALGSQCGRASTPMLVGQKLRVSMCGGALPTVGTFLTGSSDTDPAGAPNIRVTPEQRLCCSKLVTS